MRGALDGTADRILGAGEEGISADMLSLEFLSPQELP